MIFDEVMTGFKTGKRYFTEYLDTELMLCLSLHNLLVYTLAAYRTDYLEQLQYGHMVRHYLGVEQLKL